MDTGSYMENQISDLIDGGLIQMEESYEKKLDFGDYCTIEQHRYGCENEHYMHKVIGTFRSNVWVDVPVMHRATETQHDQMEDVVACICCGVSEREVLRYRLSDVRKHKQIAPPIKLNLENNLSVGDLLRFIHEKDAKATYSIQYVDYADNQWTVDFLMLPHRIERIENDNSVSRVKIKTSTGVSLMIEP